MAVHSLRTSIFLVFCLCTRFPPGWFVKMVSILNSLPSSLRSDALTTELLKAVRRTGSKFDNNYTSHRGLWYSI